MMCSLLRTCDTAEDVEADDGIVPLPEQSRETVGEQLQFWRLADAKMQASKLGTKSGLLEIMNMIRRIETQQHTITKKQSNTN